MPIAAAAQGTGNSTALVGTPEQVAEAIAKYYDLGVAGVLIRGFDPFNDAVEFGKELIPGFETRFVKEMRAKWRSGLLPDQCLFGARTLGLLMGQLLPSRRWPI